jgi:hypothetical protein
MRFRRSTARIRRRRRPTEPALRALRVAVEHHQQRIALLEQDEPLNYGVADLFEAATPCERERLAQLLGTRRSSPRALVAALNRGDRYLDTPVAHDAPRKRRRRGYRAMVRRVGGALGANTTNIIEAEAQIIANAFARMVDNLTPATMAQLAARQRALLQMLAPEAAQRISAALFASIARASGFDLYLMGSSVVVGIAAALRLPCDDPTSASTPVVSTRRESAPAPAGPTTQAALARLGWLVLAQWGPVDDSNPMKAPEAAIVLLVATLRQRLVRQRKAQLDEHQQSLQRDREAIERI